MTGNQGIVGIQIEPLRIQPDTDSTVGPATRYRITIALHGHQASAGYPSHHLDVAVKHTGHWHQMGLLDLQGCKTTGVCSTAFGKTLSNSDYLDPHAASNILAGS